MTPLETVNRGGKRLTEDELTTIQVATPKARKHLAGLLSPPQFAIASACGTVQAVEKAGRAFRKIAYLTIQIDRKVSGKVLKERRPSRYYELPECRPVLKVMCISLAHMVAKQSRIGDLVEFPRIRLWGFDTWVARVCVNFTAMEERRFFRDRKAFEEMAKDSHDLKVSIQSRRMGGDDGNEKHGDKWDW